jgi:hypothetical protein
MLFLIPASDWYYEADYHIVLTEDVLDDDGELRRGVKKVMEVIVGLLKDRVTLLMLREQGRKNISRNNCIDTSIEKNRHVSRAKSRSLYLFFNSVLIKRLLHNIE